MATIDDSSVHTIIGATPEEYHRAGFFGSSSAGTFMQNVKQLVEQKIGRAQQQNSTRVLQSAASAPLMISTGDARQKHIDYVLPSRRKADSLLAVYWNSIHVLYPYLDKVKTNQEYIDIWRGEGSAADEQSFLCLLNIMLALSSQVAGPPTDSEQEDPGHTFYLRAKDLLNLMGTGSVRSVQTFLLFGEYCQSTNEPQQSWVYAGLAIRAAQSLGLHLPQTSERVADLETRQLLRIVWYGCVLMDRMLAMTYGRPCMIGPRTGTLVPLPAIPPEGMHRQSDPGVSGRRTDDGLTMSFYVNHLKLFEILHDVLFQFYSSSAGRSQPAGEAYEKYFGQSQGQLSVLGLDQRILDWERNLPEHFRVETYSLIDTSGSIPYRQAVVLHQIHLHVRLMLLRPVLSSFVTSDFHKQDSDATFWNQLGERIFLQCSVVCVQVAKEAIETIHKRGNDPGSLAPWWFNVLFLYTAATVLVAARLSSSILTELYENSIVEGCRKAISALEEYSNYNSAIKRLVTTLRLLYDAVPRQYFRLRQHPAILDGEKTLADIVESQQADWQNDIRVNTISDSFARGQQHSSFQPSHEYEPVSPAGLSWDLDHPFDPTDITWLTTVPFDA
ncbi:hypothetical protein LTR64_001529 [Lithohypha guttulata]|uniref:uncharacterized protein n=1 Tax=Lithohypha guttulata TaxID=1690604 RepID=UPI002DDF38BC|nr:hypothetical protein LTR51_003722 [Lithohypha guttulata]